MNTKTRIFIAFLAISFMTALSAHAQTVHYSFGKANDSNRHEVGTCIKALPDGSSIIAGYRYISNTQNGSVRAILMRVQGQGIIWSREILASSTETVTDMIITRNQDIVIVGYYMDSITKSKSPSIYLFDNSGNLLAQYRHRVAISPQSGIIFTGVCELPLSGKILAVGIVNPEDTGSNPTRGYIATFQSNLTPIDFEIINSPIKRGLTFYDVESYGNLFSGNEGVIIAGSYTTADSLTHASLADFTPPSSPSTGNFNSYVYFNIAEGNKRQSKFTQLYLLKDRIFCSGILSQDKRAMVNSKQFSFQSDYYYGLSFIHPFNNFQTHTNVSKILPVQYSDSTDDFDVLITEHPNQSANDPVFSLNMPVFKGVISQISSLNNHTVNYSRSVDFFNRNPSFNDITQQTLTPISKTVNFVTGAVQTAGQGVNIEYTVFSPQLQDSIHSHCPVIDEELDLSDTFTQKQYVQPVINHIWPQVDSIRIINYPMVSNRCGTDSFQSEKCAVNLQVHTISRQNGCTFSVTATNTSVGYTVTSYTWLVTGNPPVVHNTNSSSDMLSFITVPVGLSKLVTVYVTFIDQNGQVCTAQASVPLNCITGAKMFSAKDDPDDDLSIYPNPASDHLNINLKPDEEAPMYIQIFDQYGRCVKKLENNGSMERRSVWTVSVADLPPGVYNCHIRSGNKTFNKKFVVIK